MARPDQTTIGLDFGTTNTVAALSSADGQAEVLTFNPGADSLSVFRTVLCFWEQMQSGVRLQTMDAGPWAIERFIEDPSGCRFLQSFKTFAASRAFQDTIIHGKRYRFEDLLAGFVAKLKAHAGGRLDPMPRRLVIGRPVTFAGAAPDEALAMARYEAALKDFGFDTIDYVYEPVAAAFFFAQRLTRDATILVADFGGGTSDFSVIRFELGAGGLTSTPLGHSGVGIAGDTFDYRIIDHVVSPQLGKGAQYRSFGKVLDIPGHYFANFARWNQLAIMKSSSVLRELGQLAGAAVDRAGLDRLIEMIEEDQSYPLYKVVSDVKARLSVADSATLAFRYGKIDIEAEVKRADFEAWIAEDLARIDTALDEAIQRSGLDETGIDRVFLTGGSSYIPAIRDVFARRFGPAKIETGDQLVSIAAGLALIGRDSGATSWAVARETNAA